jgi:phage-related protein
MTGATIMEVFRGLVNVLGGLVNVLDGLVNVLRGLVNVIGGLVNVLQRLVNCSISCVGDFCALIHNHQTLLIVHLFQNLV